MRKDFSNEINPRSVESQFIQTLKNTGRSLITETAKKKKEAAINDGINNKLIAKIALASGHYTKIGFDAYEQQVGSDPGSIWYLSTDASGEQWLVKDVDEKGDIIRHLVSEKMPETKKVANELTSYQDPPEPTDVSSMKAIVDRHGLDALSPHYQNYFNWLVEKGYLNADISSMHPEGTPAYGEPTRTDVANIDTLIKTYGYENLTPTYQKYADFLANRGLIKLAKIKTAAPEDFLLPNSAPQDDDTVKPMEWVTDSKEDTELSDEEKKDKTAPNGAIDPNAPQGAPQAPIMNSENMEAQNEINQELGEGKGDVELRINPQELTSFVDFPNTPSKVDEKKPAVPLDMQQVEPLFDPSKPIQETRRPSAEKEPSPEVY